MPLPCPKVTSLFVKELTTRGGLLVGNETQNLIVETVALCRELISDTSASYRTVTTAILALSGAVSHVLC
jgi:hypothetical protein